MPLALGATVLALMLDEASQRMTPWEAYVSKPTSENARRVEVMAYSSQGSEPGDLREIETDLGILESQIVASDAEAVRLGFRLLGKADGHVGELLSEMLGRLIRINPRLFLKELKAHRSSVPGLGSLVAALGYAFVDRFDAQAYEREARAAALKSVTDPHLRAVRDECLRALAS